MSPASRKKEPAGPIIAPLSLVKAIWNRKALIVTTWLGLTAATVAIVHRWPATYRAQALIMVESQRIPEKYVSATVNSDLEDRLNVLRQQILSYSHLLEVIDKYGLYSDRRKIRSNEDIVELMRDDTTIRLEQGMLPGRPAAFSISYGGPNPVLVAQVTNVLANFFIEENLRAREVEAAGTSEFLEAQLAEAKKRLEEQERQLSQYKLQYNGELPQQENAMLSSLAQLKVQLMGAQDSLNRVQQNKIALEMALENAESSQTAFNRLLTPATPSDTHDATTAAPRQVPTLRESERLQQQIDLLRARYSDNHPEMKRLAQALAQARVQEASGTSAPREVPTSGPAHRPTVQDRPELMEVTASNRERINTLRRQIASAERDLQNVNRERDGILRDIASVEARVGKLPVREQQLAAVTRDYEITKANYRSLLDKKLAADVASDMERRQKSERFVLLEMARPPVKPVKPQRELLDVAGSALGLILGLMLGLVLELRKSVVMGAWEIPVGIPVLGYVPPIPRATKPLPWNKWKRAVLVVGLLSVVLAAIPVGWQLGWWKF